jgi:hypothetical protein
MGETALKLRYCYEISAEAGLATDEEGNPVECLTQYEISVMNEPPEAVKAGLQDEFRESLAELLGIPVQWIKKITPEEYDQMTEDEQ